MPDVHVVTVDAAAPQAVARVHAIRFEVFVDEQGVARSDERDERDREPGTVHLLAVGEAHSSHTASAEHYQEAGIWHRDAVKPLRPGGA
ncbi:hypothetical protein [Ruania rhizosphaerae]|uniref:hypothetical protein n=1 Tax=Ruania rhizosphaerae TaxID=1840413 RepID=UPI001358C313|nr:hypothetical protein [Ruania rhizosphaerae]